MTLNGFFLFVLSILIFVFIGPLSFCWALFKWIIGQDLRRYFFRLALSVDQLGNVLGAPLFNDVLIKEEGFKFGNPDHTISAVLGKNKKEGTLSRAGAWLAAVLNKIDPGHVERAAALENIK